MKLPQRLALLIGLSLAAFGVASCQGGDPGHVSPKAEIHRAYTEILRCDPSRHGASFTTALAEVDSGLLSTSQVVADVITMARGTTSVATLNYQFFTHGTPTVAGIDYLVSPTGPNKNNLNSPYYQAMNQDNRFINFAVNLGTVGAGAAEFKATYGPMTVSEATSKAYFEIFGAHPTAGKVAAILKQEVGKNADGSPQTREQYLAAIGKDGPQAIGTKAAIVGWLLSQSVTSNVGDYALSNNAFLTDIAKGSTKYGIDMIAKYNKPENHYKGG